MATAVAPKGLEGIVATTSSICWIDGDAGVLSYRGIDIHELAERSTFEETTFLLWFGHLPNSGELADFTKKLAEARKLDPKIIELLRSVPSSGSPMEILRTAVSLLSLYDTDEKDNSHDANVRKAYRLTSQIAMIVAILDRIRKGKPVVDADPTLSHAANFLWMLNGDKPSDTAVRTFDIALILHADHELNASTFAARVIAATLADIHSAITGAIGALKGPLHGGAPARVLPMIQEVERTGDAEQLVRSTLDRGERLMGFGHRVYRAEDPRARVLRTTAKRLGAQRYEAAAALEQAALSELRDRRPDRAIETNVEFWAAVILEFAEVPAYMMPAMFTCARTAGWSAHILEQKRLGKLVRPAALYAGPDARTPDTVEGWKENLVKA